MTPAAGIAEYTCTELSDTRIFEGGQTVQKKQDDGRSLKRSGLEPIASRIILNVRRYKRGSNLLSERKVRLKAQTT